jgi:hypothetical protein
VIRFRPGAAWFALLLGAAGCVPIPHHHRRRPELTFWVRSPDGRAIAGATVRVYGQEVYTPGRPWAAAVATDAAGRAHFPELRDRHGVYYLLPHGEVPWTWAWCAEAPGRRAVAAPLVYAPSDSAASHISVTMPAGGAAACPTTPESVADVPQAAGAS